MTLQEIFSWLDTPTANPVILVETSRLAGGVETPVRLADRPYRDGVQIWDARIAGGVSWSASLNVADSTARTGHGDVEIDGGDDELVDWPTSVWHGRQIRILVGDISWPAANMVEVARGHIDRLSSRKAGRYNLVWRDEAERMRAPVATRKLLDAWPQVVADGYQVQKDAILPLCFGEAFNVPALLIHPGEHRYQVNDGQIEAVLEVRDNGAPVAFTADLAAGTYTLAAKPTGEVCSDIQGAKPSAWIATAPEIAATLATQYGDAYWRLDPSEIATLPSLPQPLGLWLDGQARVWDTVQSVAASVGCAALIDRAGKLSMAPITTSGTPVATVTATDIKANTFIIEDQPAPAAKVRLGYGRNHAARASGLAAGLTEEGRTALSTEYLFAEAVDTTLAADWRLPLDADDEDSLLIVEADAAAEAARRLAVRGPALVASAETSMRHAWLWPGDWVTITHHRHGFAVGRSAMVTAVDVDLYARTCKLGFWSPWQP